MIPTIYDIATKDIVTIGINKTLEDAINKIIEANLRTIVIVDEKKYHILDTSLLIDYKIDEVNLSTTLLELNLPIAKALNKDLNILNVLNQITSIEEYMVVLDEHHNLIGIISHTDILNNIDPVILMKKQTLATLILNYKVTITYKNSSTLLAIKEMKKSGNDAIIIIENDEKPIGIFSTKDFIDLVALDSDFSKPISTYMTSPIITLHENSTIEKALEFIKNKQFKRIVIVNDENKVAGVISQKELLRVVYNKWVDFLKEEGTRISKSNEKLLASKNQLEEIASVDFLTQIYNRQKFDTFLEYEINKIKRYQDSEFSILLVDLDFFKYINDEYGHLKGDMVLKEVAKILTLCSRDTDIVARWGGEEFVMLLPHTDIKGALLVAQKFRATVEGHKFEDNIKVTCSAGVSQFHNKDTKESLFKRADIALYKAKDLGRNRVEMEYMEEED